MTNAGRNNRTFRDDLSSIYLTEFSVLRPQYENVQEYGVEWLVEAHTTAERTARIGRGRFDESRFRVRMRRLIDRYCCGSDRIARRGHELDDFCHLDWSRMRIFRLHERPAGAVMDTRSDFYRDRVEAAFEHFYPQHAEPPRDLIHVTCTGYISPSGAQKIVERRGWNRCTTVTHAYHMGCYAALPAIRIAEGFLSRNRQRLGGAPVVDIVHTELCTVHLNPASHTPEQLVVQSLFADGMIRYRLTRKPPSRPALKLLSVREEVLPRSENAMTWECADFGMRMGLAREVPDLIADALHGFLARLFEEADMDLADRAETLFAIHPGGPRIIDRVAEVLGLQMKQVAVSREILLQYGNMSSATLPHVWERILSHRPTDGELVVGLAFGPGLSVCGGLFRVHAPTSRVET